MAKYDEVTGEVLARYNGVKSGVKDDVKDEVKDDIKVID